MERNADGTFGATGNQGLGLGGSSSSTRGRNRNGGHECSARRNGPFGPESARLQHGLPPTTRRRPRSRTSSVR